MLELLLELHRIEVPAQLAIFNPLGVPVTSESSGRLPCHVRDVHVMVLFRPPFSLHAVVGVNGTVTYNDTVMGPTPIGYIYYDIPTGPNVTIPANSSYLTPVIPIEMLLTGAAFAHTRRHSYGTCC